MENVNQKNIKNVKKNIFFNIYNFYYLKKLNL